MPSKKRDPVASLSGNLTDLKLDVSSAMSSYPTNVVITQPSLEKDNPATLNLPGHSDNESDCSQLSAACSSGDVSDNDNIASNDQLASLKKADGKKTLSTSRSLGSLSAQYFKLGIGKTNLKVPRRSLITNRRTSSCIEPSSRTLPQNSSPGSLEPDLDEAILGRRNRKKGGTFPGRTSLDRSRSSSPSQFKFSRSKVGKTISLGEASLGGIKPAFVRFFTNISTGSPSASSKDQQDFVWLRTNSTGSTSDGVDGTDMIISQNATDSSQIDANGVESYITATRTMPLGSTTGSTSSGNGLPGDVVDGLPSGNETQREHLQQKILKISEQITKEQASRDENVAEYLKLANHADKQQAARIKSVFEKKNQKSKAIVMQLQKKLETYHKRLRDMESGSKNTSGKYGLKEVGAKITDLSGSVVDSVKQGASGFVSKPRDIASKIINKRFGSVDNIATLKEDDAGSEDLERSNSVGDVSIVTSDSGEVPADFNATSSTRQHSSQQHLDLSSYHLEYDKRFKLLSERIDSFENGVKQIQQLEADQKQLKEDINQINLRLGGSIDNLQDFVSYRCSQIDDRLQDWSDKHHQDMASLEEKIEYHAQERARDIQEALESCQTRIAKMEVQQQHQNQQLVTMEGVENDTARALLGKLINLLLSVLAVILVFVSTVSSIVMPFIKDQTRIATTGICVLFLALLYRNWEPWTLYISQLWTDR